MDVDEVNVAMVTGTGSGIGKATALRLLADGWKVFGFDINSNSELEACSGYTHAQVDLTDLASISEVVEHTSLSSKSNLLVNCAGIREICSIDELSVEMWTKVIEPQCNERVLHFKIGRS
ncbi:SDR family NAD(P)-dependent oxidoreductase [Pseudomonas savastanoi]|uniref:SDR family NAD(P)-dependent oxidoreductase n=1 Tax=Pseudomonas savastanoi TaxID=29438 RepID=UPI001F191C48|nr:SDR family NAD(P)-dependent oxidoreductase [Pseudomonas savastanoi]